MSTGGTETKVCPQCGANCFTDAARCWLCRADLSKPPQIVTAEVVTDPPQHALSEWFFAILTILAIVFVVLIGIGVALQEPVLGVIYAGIVALPLAASAVRMQSKKAQQGGNLTWLERFSTLMLTAAVTVGIIAALGVAAFGAFFVWCLMSISNSNFH